MKKIANGVWKLRYGDPEEFTPEYFRKFEMQTETMNNISISLKLPFTKEDIQFSMTGRGVICKLPMNTDEDIFGFGLQLQELNHVGRRRFIKVNSDPPANTGESHAPVPFYISTMGYGVFVDTLRYTTFEIGTNASRGASFFMTAENELHKEFSESALYAFKRAKDKRSIIIEIPSVKGIDLYFFEGNVKEIVQRYIMFSGGGCVPPMWGLGVWYRNYGGSNQKAIMEIAESFRNDRIPIDVLGLEPGWHSHSYSCSYKWSNLFPEPQKMIDKLSDDGYKINLWEHLFVYPTAPFYKDMLPYSGEYEVWNGLVPDLGSEEARKLLETYHYQEFVDKGIMGFKLDECDNSDYNVSNWSFPDNAQFPSGMDGEQMHSAIGLLYQQSIFNIYKKANKRTYSQVRSSGALCAPLPFVLYSDLYNHKEYIRGIVNSGFSGMLWCPEVRSCVDEIDLLRRIETTVFSAHTLINSWRIPSPPWKQVNVEKNLAGEMMEEASCYTDTVRKLFELRMSLLPYLYSAFVKYHKTGIPPIRSMVMDYPYDLEVRTIDDQYMFGDDLLVCPLTREDEKTRKLYLPKGTWYDFFTNEKQEGGKIIEVHAEYEEIPVFVKEGSIVPLANPVEYVSEETVFGVKIHVYGEISSKFDLYEDDFVSFYFEKEQMKIVLNKNR